MKKRMINLTAALLCAVCLAMSACGKVKDYKLDETTFFLVMTNMQFFPEQYLKSQIELDCFIYELYDVDGNKYVCGVRKCSSGYGCTCGNDTVIGFILESETTLPQPKNQSQDSNDKAWIHLNGKLKSAKTDNITIYAYKDGQVDYSATESLSFLTFVVESFYEIEDYSALNYYVTK